MKIVCFEEVDVFTEDYLISEHVHVQSGYYVEHFITPCGKEYTLSSKIYGDAYDLVCSSHN